jgi:hypothetical protein
MKKAQARKYLSIFTVFVASLIFTNAALAGFNGLTRHSRANCYNNESISWDATTYRVLGTVSNHYHGNMPTHYISSGWQNTWRSAAVHWGEGKGGRHVIGYHWIREGGQDRLMEVTDTWDCTVYDGWWDKN